MDLDQLKMLSDLKFQNSQKALSDLLIRENILRAELSRLRQLARETQSQPPEQEQMRLIGGDVIWLQWLGQTQQRLNNELAQILARKEMLIDRHRRAHGRKIVSQKIAEQEADARNKAKRKGQLDSAINHALLR